MRQAGESDEVGSTRTPRPFLDLFLDDSTSIASEMMI
jgi:hypothetical protein